MESQGDSQERERWEVPHVHRAPDAPRHTAPGTFSPPEDACDRAGRSAAGPGRLRPGPRAGPPTSRPSRR